MTTVALSRTQSGTLSNHASDTDRQTRSRPSWSPSCPASGITCLLAKAVTPTRVQLSWARASTTIRFSAKVLPAPAAALSRRRSYASWPSSTSCNVPIAWVATSRF